MTNNISLIFLLIRWKTQTFNDIDQWVVTICVPSALTPPHPGFIFPLGPATHRSASGEHVFLRVILLKALLQAALHPTELLSSSGGQPGVEEWANSNDTGGVSES